MCADIHCPDREYLAGLHSERLDVSDAYAASGHSVCVWTHNFVPDARPWYFNTFQGKMIARSAAVFSRSGMKCAILVYRSMITYIWSHSSDVRSSVMKSIAIDCHGAYRSSKGDDRPYGWCRAALFC